MNKRYLQEYSKEARPIFEKSHLPIPNEWINPENKEYELNKEPI